MKRASIHSKTLSTLSAALLLTAGGSLHAADEAKPKPNILVILLDDMGYGDLGFTGSKAIRTPNIDKLASDGVVLSNYHSASPVCSPSRAGLLTGRLPPRAAVPDVIFPSDSPIRRTVSGSTLPVCETA